MASFNNTFRNIVKAVVDFFSKLISNIKKINLKNMSTSQKRKFLVYGGGALLLLIILIIIIALICNAVKKKNIDEMGCTFTTKGYERVVDAECVNEQVIVYSDKNGKKGIISLDGTITQKADQNRIFAVNNEWRSYVVVAENNENEYLYIVDTESGEVSSRQYQDVEEPPRTAAWSADNVIEWIYPDGSFSSIQPSELILPEGYYPISDPAGSKYGYIDNGFNLVIPLEYTNACDFSGNLAAVEKNGKWGYIDKTGKTIIDFDYKAIGKTAFSFRNGLAPVSDGEKCGIIDEKGKTVVAFEFEVILQGEDGKYIAKKDGKWGLIEVNKDRYKAEKKTEPVETEEAYVLYTVTTSKLNIRAQGSKDAEKVGELDYGDQIQVYEISGDWARIKYYDIEGWVNTSYIEPVTEG